MKNVLKEARQLLFQKKYIKINNHLHFSNYQAKKTHDRAKLTILFYLLIIFRIHFIILLIQTQTVASIKKIYKYL